MYDFSCQHNAKQWHQDGASQTELLGALGFHPENREVMFNLSGAVSYKYIPNYKDMRGGYDKLCEVVRRKYFRITKTSDNGRTYRHRTNDNANQLRVVSDSSVGF